MWEVRKTVECDSKGLGISYWIHEAIAYKAGKTIGKRQI
jgi:hypothetical protein